MEAVSQTLAGRCGILHLLPFSGAELELQAQTDDRFLRLCTGRIGQIVNHSSLAKACWTVPRIRVMGNVPAGSAGGVGTPAWMSGSL